MVPRRGSRSFPTVEALPPAPRRHGERSRLAGSVAFPAPEPALASLDGPRRLDRRRTFGAARAQRAPTRLPLPYFTAPELSSRAAEKLGEAVAAFERRMAETQVAPNIADMLTASKKTEYLLNTKEGEFRLYLPETYHGQAVSPRPMQPYQAQVRSRLPAHRPRRRPLQDPRRLPPARGRVQGVPRARLPVPRLRREESPPRGRGKEARRRRPQVRDGDARRDQRRGRARVPRGRRVADERRHEARRSLLRRASRDRRYAPRDPQVRLGENRRARVDFKLAPWRVASVERPNWRFKEADPITGDPDDARDDARRNANPRGRR